MNYEEILFNFISGYGDAWNDAMCIFNNTGPNAKGDIHYRVFVKGGIAFDISQEKGKYYFSSVWIGALESKTAEDVLPVLVMLGFDPYREMKVETTP